MLFLFLCIASSLEINIISFTFLFQSNISAVSFHALVKCVSSRLPPLSFHATKLAKHEDCSVSSIESSKDTKSCVKQNKGREVAFSRKSKHFYEKISLFLKVVALIDSTSLLC